MKPNAHARKYDETEKTNETEKERERS